MICQSRGRPTKHVSSGAATLTSSQKVHVRRIKKVLWRKQLKLRQQRILELASTNFCSKSTGKKLSSIRDLKNFARHLGKTTVSHVHNLWQQGANKVLEDCKSPLQFEHDHVYWNNTEFKDTIPDTGNIDNIFKSKDDESSIDVHMNQWVGVEVHLFGKKNSIGEIGSTTSNVCDKLRSIVANPEREDIYLSFANKRDEHEERKWSLTENDGIVPSWVSCRRSITRMNASSGISNDHIAALLASLPKTKNHIGKKTMTPINISSAEEIGLGDPSSIETIPKEQSFISQGSIVNIYKDLSLDFNLGKQANASSLHKDAIQVCPTTPEKAQKRRRSYQDTILNHNEKAIVCELSCDKLPTDYPHACPSIDANNFKEVGGQVHLTDSLSPHSMEIESSCNSTRLGERDLNVVVECARSLVDSMPIPAKAYHIKSISHLASTILDPVQESFQHLQSHEPSISNAVMDDGDKSVKEVGQVLLPDSVSPYFVDFESSCNSTRIDKQGSNHVAIECAGSLVKSIPTPSVAPPYNSVPHITTLTTNLIEDNSQHFQKYVPTTSILMVEPNKRKGKHAKSKSNEDFGASATKISKVRKKYKPRVAKFKKIDKNKASHLQNETNEMTKDHHVSKHARTKGICHDIIKHGVHKEISIRNNSISHNPLKCIGTTEESGKSFYQKESLTSRLDKLASKSTTPKSIDETPSSINNTCVARNNEGYMTKLHPPLHFDLEYDRIASDFLLDSACGLKQRIINEGSNTRLLKQSNNVCTPSEDEMISNWYIERQNQCEARSIEMTNNLCTPSEDEMLSNLCVERQKQCEAQSIEMTNNLCTPSEDEMLSNLCTEKQKQFEALSIELSNRVIALLDLPSIRQSHSHYSIVGESIVGDVKQSVSDILLCNEEVALKEYPQTTNECLISSFSDEWTPCHVGFAETSALDAFNDEEMQFDMFSKEQQSIVQGDTLFQNFNAEFNEYFSFNTDSWESRSPACVENECGRSSNLQYHGIDELGNGCLMQPNSNPKPVKKSLMTQSISLNSLEERTMSSFYASTSTEVNDMMLSRLNKIVEENCQKDVSGTKNAEQNSSVEVSLHCGRTGISNMLLEQNKLERCKSIGLLGDNCLEEEDLMQVRNKIICQMRSQFQDPDPGHTLSTESDVVRVEQSPEDLMNMRDAILCQMRSQFQDPDPDSTFSTESDLVLVEENCEVQDLLKMGDNVLLQTQPQFLNPNPNSSFILENATVLGHNTPNVTKDSMDCQLSFQSQDANLGSNFVRRDTTLLVEVSDNLEGNSHKLLLASNATFNSTTPQKNSCLEERPFRLMTFIQLIEYIRTILVNTPGICPLELSCHIQNHLSEEERVEFEKLWPVILHLIDSEQVQRLVDLAKLDFSTIAELIQCQQGKKQEDGVKSENMLSSCRMEGIQCQQVKGQDDGTQEGNNLTPCLDVVQYQQTERHDDDRAKGDNHVIGLDPLAEEGSHGVIGLEPSVKEDNLVMDLDPSVTGGNPETDFDPLAKEDSHLGDAHVSIKEDNHLTVVDPLAKDGNPMTQMVPFVGNAIVAYDGILRKRKPRPKVNLDTETIRVWKMLMGKTESIENDPDLDNELKWKHERLIMQEQADTFIRRMHLIQGDRSFSRWKGSIVDSVIGVFLTQNVSDVLSSSAYMCLRARFPLGQAGSVSHESSEGGEPEEIFQGDVQMVVESERQTFPDAPAWGGFHNYASSSRSSAPTNLPNHENREEILLPSQDRCNEENNTPTVETSQSRTSLGLPWRERLSSLTPLQPNGSEFHTHADQPPIIVDTSLDHAPTQPTLEFQEEGANENAHVRAFGLEIAQQSKISFFVSGNHDNPEPLPPSTRLSGETFLGDSNAHCVGQAQECGGLPREVTTVLIDLESRLALSTSLHLQPKEELTGLERARLEAEQVRARKSSKWNALADKYNAQRQQAALEDDAAAWPRAEMTEDGVDWEAVRCADLEEIADAIKERGMNWKLAGRIKGFLDRLRTEQGSINLEWLRSIPSEDAKEFLSSVHGLGLKSVECIRLLTLHHLAFPVDTNVGRICVRLGWVPLEPLPEELQLHVLELYPVQATIQKYLWPRLCTLDQHTLYELHYQLITFGKVFCTKSKPNCNACPMRPDCKHFASALASAKLALPPPEDASSSGPCPPLALLPPGNPVRADGLPDEAFLLPKPRTAQPSMNISQYCQPIIEEPSTPADSEADTSEFDIEDYPCFSIEEIPTDVDAMMELLIQEIRIHGRQQEVMMMMMIQQQQQLDRINRTGCGNNHFNLGVPAAATSCCGGAAPCASGQPNVVQEEMDDVMDDVAADSESPQTDAREMRVLQPRVERLLLQSSSASSPEPVANGVVVECEDLPGKGGCWVATTGGGSSAALVPEAPSSREVVVVPPGLASLPAPKLKNIERLRTVHYVYELPDSHPLLEGMDVREVDDPCFYLLAVWSPGEVPESIPNINDDNEDTAFHLPNDEESIKATLLVPCRTAMKGSFPLNGTYFQVNEVFADHESSLQPKLVPRILLWNLRRRFVYFGTSVTSILRGMTTEEIQACFWRGYICVRGFDRVTRAPKPLVRRLHLQSTKSVYHEKRTRREAHTENVISS